MLTLFYMWSTVVLLFLVKFEKAFYDFHPPDFLYFEIGLPKYHIMKSIP